VKTVTQFLESETLAPLDRDELLPPVRRWTSLGGWLLVGMLGAAGLFAMQVECNVTVRATGRLYPVAVPRVVRPETDGIVYRVAVRDGETVRAGDRLLVLATGRDREALQRRQEQLQRYLKTYRGQLDRVELEIDRLAGEIFQAAQWQALEMQNPETSLTYRVGLALDRLVKSDDPQADSLRERWVDLLAQQDRLQRQIDRDRNQSNTLETQLETIDIIAPIDGSSQSLQELALGQKVLAGESIFKIVPPSDRFFVRVRVPERDIARIRSQQTAQLAIAAYPHTDYGLLPAVVGDIEPEATVITDNGVEIGAYYNVTLEPTRSFFIRNERSYPLKAGMEVQAEIVTDRETIAASFFRQARLLQ